MTGDLHNTSYAKRHAQDILEIVITPHSSHPSLPTNISCTSKVTSLALLDAILYLETSLVDVSQPLSLVICVGARVCAVLDSASCADA